VNVNYAESSLQSEREKSVGIARPTGGPAIFGPSGPTIHPIRHEIVISMPAASIIATRGHSSRFHAVMSPLRWLALLPFLAILIGAALLNQVTPFVAGLPLLFAWLLLWIVLTSGIMGLIYLTDPANRAPGADGKP
jgi:hypothetical protein